MLRLPLSALLLVEVRAAQRVDQPLVDQTRRIALVIEVVLFSKLVNRGDRLVVERRVLAVVGRGRGPRFCRPLLEFGGLGATKLLHSRLVRVRRRSGARR